MYTTVIDCASLARHLSDPAWVVVDCRFDLADTEAGRHAYMTAHVPSAVYAHLDADLSGPPLTDKGRHPLPSAEALRALFGRFGISNATQVIVYDATGGVFAGRLWWMLRYMGHDAVAVLDGGWPAWQAGGYPTHSGVESNPPATFDGAPNRDMLVLLDDVSAQPLLVDARDDARFRGDTAGPDARAGHIPGAKQRHFSANWDAQQALLPPAELRAQFEALFGDVDSADVTFYCGSGVSACVNILAQVHAGLRPGKLYVGSWSEWSRTDRPAEREA